MKLVPVVDQLGALGKPNDTTGMKVAADVPNPPKVGSVGIAKELMVGVVVGAVVPGAGGVMVMIGLKAGIGN